MRFSVLCVSNRCDTLKQIYSPHEGDFEKPDKLSTKIAGTEHSSPADPLSSLHVLICLLGLNECSSNEKIRNVMCASLQWKGQGISI